MASDPRFAFCFAGHGFVPLEAARDFYRASDVFRTSIQEVEDAVADFYKTELDPRAFISIPEYLEEAEARPAFTPNFENDSRDNLPTTPPATIVIFAAQYALARTVQEAGVRPWSVVGYSLGETVAAIFTKDVPLDVGIRLLLRRDKLYNNRDLIPDEGGMVTVQTDRDTTLRTLAKAGLSGTVDVGGYPHPGSTILSGNAKALDIAQETLSRDGIENQRRSISLGMHSSHVDRAASELRHNPAIFPPEDSAKAKVSHGIAHWSCLGIELPQGTPLNANHWATIWRQPIHFKQCIEGMYNAARPDLPQKRLIYLDVGMGPRLTRLVQNTLQKEPDWEKGNVQGISCIASNTIDEAAKSQTGWSLKLLEKSLKPFLQPAQGRGQARFPTKPIGSRDFSTSSVKSDFGLRLVNTRKCHMLVSHHTNVSSWDMLTYDPQVDPHETDPSAGLTAAVAVTVI